MDDRDDADEIERVGKVIRGVQKEQLGWLAETLSKLAAAGKIEASVRIQTSLSHNALTLGQIDWTRGQDYERALAEFNLPLDRPDIPRFDMLAQAITEGMRGQRLWNGVKLSLQGQIYRVLCYLLAGRDKELVSEYRDIDRDNFFDPADALLYQSVFTRHLLMAFSGRPDRVSLQAYEGAGLKKTSELYGYHFMLDAIARGDSGTFNEELTRCTVKFKKRRSSKRDIDPWGYGAAADYSFDIVGTVLCRLASQRGLEFAVTPLRYYPSQFWQTM